MSKVIIAKIPLGLLSYDNIKVPDKTEYWRKFNASANFLKHADGDWSDHLSLEKINNEELLTAASCSYTSLLSRTAPEIEAFAIFTMGDQDGFATPFGPASSAKTSGSYLQRGDAASARGCFVF